MIPTFQDFSRALLTPDLSLVTLRTAQPAKDADNLPILTRSTRFAEAQVEWRGEQWLVSMPLAPTAIYQIEQTLSQLNKLNTPLLPQCQLLQNEMRWTDRRGEPRATNLIIQHLPAGLTFEQALQCESKETLLTALDVLQEGLRALNFTHNNLKSHNLRWCGDRFIALRYHDAHLNSGDDSEAFDALRNRIVGAADSFCVNDTTAPYKPLRRLEGHRWTSHVFEGLICVEDDGGYGFVDTNNNPVIAAQYLWAGDFREGRAEVQTAQGMGLIDRQGRYIIPPQYEIVDYDPASSIIHVRLDGSWALFDYLGQRLTEFGIKNEEAAKTPVTIK